MNSNEYITQTLLNNLVGMNYNGREVIEVRLLSHNESREFTDVILVRYGQEINDKIFLHPAHAKYSYLTAERILLVEYPRLWLHPRVQLYEVTYIKIRTKLYYNHERYDYFSSLYY